MCMDETSTAVTKGKSFSWVQSLSAQMLREARESPQAKGTGLPGSMVKKILLRDQRRVGGVAFELSFKRM